MSNAAYKAFFAFAVLISFFSRAAGSQNLFYIEKGLVGIQGASSGPVPDTFLGPYIFSATAPSPGSVTPPGLSPSSLSFVSGSSDYEFTEFLSTLSALNAVAPDGSFMMSGGGFPTLSIGVTGDLYPIVPEITNGTWQNDVLLVNPAQSYTLNLNTFTGYGTNGVGGLISIQIQSLTTADNVNLSQKYSTQSFGNAVVSSTPFTSYTIPAGTLQPGLVYEVLVEYYTLSSVNTTTVPGYYIVGAYENTLVAYIGTTSSPAVTGPTIALEPTNQTVAAGASATFNVAVTFGNSSVIPPNTPVLWWANGSQITGSGSGKYAFGGANNASLTINNVGASDVGTYFVQVINAGGSVASTIVTLSLASGTPVITTQPTASQTVNAGANVILSVAATNAGSYQWQLNGAPISGATSATLALDNIGTSQRGTYTVVVSNGPNSVTSNPASVAVNVSSYLFNISTRGYVGSGPNQDLDAGFYIEGTGNKNILLRGDGPFLATNSAYTGLTLVSPQLTFNNAGGQLGVNTAWGGSQILVNAFNTVFAPVFATGSKDTAIYMSVSANGSVGYTADITSATSGGTGVAQIEVDDADAFSDYVNNPSSTPPSHLINISTHGYVGAGGGEAGVTGASQYQYLDAGFYIFGGSSQTLLIRALGPGLATNNPGLSGLTLPNPALTLYDSSGNIIATNTGWGNEVIPGNSTAAAGIQPATTAIMSSVYASTIAAGSTDCAMVVTLPAGTGYTAEVTSANNASAGIALVEVYNVP
jgi:hypothetical protein